MIDRVKCYQKVQKTRLSSLNECVQTSDNLKWHKNLNKFSLNLIKFNFLPQNRWPQLVSIEKRGSLRQTGHWLSIP